MKVLLTTLNSQYVHSNLALKYLYTVSVKEECDCELREFTINNDRNYIFTEILRPDYNLVCFSCYVWNIEEIKRLCAELKLAKPDMKIALGGPEVSYNAVEFMQENWWADFILTGEGEYPFYRFVQELNPRSKEKYGIETIPNLVYRDNEEATIYENQAMEPLEFSSIPFPYSLLDCEKDKVVYYESSRGCPFNCSYCMSSIDKSVRTLPIDRVRQELSYFLYKKVPQVKFVDRTFNFDRKRALEIVNYILENDNGVTNFHLELCADLVDDELLNAFSKARKGLFQVEIGIQSINPQTLKAVNRNENVNPVLYNTEKIIELGNIHVHVDLISGLPFEDITLFEKSFDRVYKLGANAFQLGFLKMLKGTSLYNEAEQYAIVYRETAPYEVISTKYMSAGDFVSLKMIDKMLDTYYNRGGFSNIMEYLIKVFEDKNADFGPFRFYKILSEFYYDKGFQNRDRRKDDQYRSLYSFICDASKKGIIDDEEKAKEILDYDARKNMDELNYGRFIRKGWEEIING